MSQDDRFTRADALFDRALDLTAAERPAFLDRECDGDGELRALVERLLASAATRSGDVVQTGGGLAAAAAPPADRSGTLLGGRYRLLREAGRGGMGVIYEAHDEHLQRTVAVKLLAVPAIDERTRERFLREARAAAALNHPNIVAIHDAGEDGGLPYLVQEFVAGAALDARPPQSHTEALAIARQVCDALEHAHARDVVHRDLKPGNVLVQRTAAGVEAKLADLGIALTRASARVTQTGTIAGTPTFMAPEQALGREVDGRADLYALGVMLYLWAAGRPPFDGDNVLAIVSQHIHAPVVPPRTFRTDLPAGLEPVILRLLEKDPAARFGSAAEVRVALDAVGGPQQGQAAPQRVAIEGLARGRLVGRQEVLARVQQCWRDALAGRGHLVLISGEPGVGKTRLARELVATARLDGAMVLNGGCYEHEATTPYLPFLEAFRQVVRERDSDELRDALGDSAAEIARLAPEIETRFGPFPAKPRLSPQEERLRLFDHVARFLRRLAGRRGLLFFLDDLQWADHGSLALLHYLLRQFRDPVDSQDRLLFLGTYREVELDRAHPLSRALIDWERERAATRVRLDRLDREATEHMVATLLGQQEVSGEFAGSLYVETEGNPFFVEEIVKALIAEGDLVHDGTGWRRRSTGEFVLPQSVKAAIGSRLDRVGETCGEVLRTAAVLGKQFDFEELGAVSRCSEDELLDALDEAAAAQLIVSTGGESFAFTHDKIREVLYDELNPIRRRRLHGAIAEGLERLAERPGAQVAVEELAHHAIESGDNRKGLQWAERAAGSARVVFAYDEALEMLVRARECAEALDEVETLQRIDRALGDVTMARGDVAGATGHYERALAAGGDVQPRNELRCLAAEAYVIAGDPRGLEHVRRALDELDRSRHPRETAQAIMLQARYLHLAGKLRRAVELYRSAMELVEPSGSDELQLRMLSYLAGSLQHLAELDESNAVSRRCMEIGERENLPVGVMLGLEFLMENAVYAGEFARSLEHGEHEERLARETHAGERFGWSHFRSFALQELGRLDEADAVTARGLAAARQSGDRRLQMFLCMREGTGKVLRGDLEAGVAILRRALEQVDEADWIGHRICARGELAAALRDAGGAEEAAAGARAAIGLWRASESSGVMTIYGAWFAEALLRAGAAGEARETLDAHRELARKTGSAYRLAQNARVRARMAWGEGCADEALALLDSAVATHEAGGTRLELIRALALRGVMRGASGDAGRAEADRERARALVAKTGAAATLLDAALEAGSG